MERLGDAMIAFHPEKDPVVVPLHCPLTSCDSEQAVISVRSATVITFRCAKCEFVWAVDVRRLPAALRESILNHRGD